MPATPAPIPLLDLNALHQPIVDQLNGVWSNTLNTSDFISGDAVESFEQAYAEYCGHEHVVSCGNGTDALELVLDALDIGPGDEVIVPSMTWFATAEVVSTRGARPVFADVDPTTNGLSAALVEPLITDDTAAVIVVHLYGHPADLPGLSKLCDARGLALIEDCAQSHGSTINGRKVGTWGRAATYSFFPSKNLGCLGDGGAVGTDDQALADRVGKLSRHGQAERHRHVVAGRNSRLDTLQAKVLLLKLPLLDAWVQERNRLAKRYSEALSGLADLTTPSHGDANTLHGFHLYVVLSPQRTALQQALSEAQIASSVHYPTPIPLQPAYTHRKLNASDYPVSVRISDEGLSLPLYPGMTDEQQDRVIQVITQTLAS